MAALNLTHCSMSAAATAVFQHMIDSMGIGWCYTFFGLFIVAFPPCLWVVMKWGPRCQEIRFIREAKKGGTKRTREKNLAIGFANAGSSRESGAVLNWTIVE